MHVKKIGFIFGLMFGLSGCMQPDVTVRSLAEQRWDALIHGDFARAYALYDEAFQKSTSFDAFSRRTQGVGLWSDAHIQSVTCTDKTTCQVAVDVSVSLKMAGVPEPVVTTDTVTETWVNHGWFSDWRYNPH